MNKLIVSTLNICIATFPWDDEQTACVHSQHLYCYISLGWWTHCLCPLSTSVLLHCLGMVNKLLVSTLNIFIVTFPWDDEQTACVHSQHLYCYISLGWQVATSIWTGQRYIEEGIRCVWKGIWRDTSIFCYRTDSKIDNIIFWLIKKYLFTNTKHGISIRQKEKKSVIYLEL